MNDAAKEDAEALAESRSTIESVQACLHRIANVHPSEQTCGKYIRDSYIVNNWVESPPGIWQKIQDQVGKYIVTKGLDRRMTVWCTHQMNSMKNRNILEEVARILGDLETKGRAQVQGLSAISIMRKMGLWDDYVLCACGLCEYKKMVATTMVNRSYL